MIGLLALLAVKDAPKTCIATYFKGNGEAGVYLAYSTDGDTFKPIVEPEKPIIAPEIGPDKLMRDACLSLGPDKMWTLVWTTGWWDKGIGIARSKDLVKWSKQEFIPVMERFDTTLNAWAPEITYDSKRKEYVIFWSSTLTDQFPATRRDDGDKAKNGEPLNHRFFYCTTKDFKTYSRTALLYDPEFNCIDATLLAGPKGSWILFGKDETKAPSPEKNLFFATALSPSGPFTLQKKKITGDYWAEGPTAVMFGKTTRVYFDKYMEGKWGAIETTDNQVWADVSAKINFPAGARHGTVVACDQKLIDRLQADLK